MSSFIPNPYQEEEEYLAIQKSDDTESSRYARVTVSTYGSRCRTKFVVLNRPKSANK